MVYNFNLYKDKLIITILHYIVRLKFKERLKSKNNCFILLIKLLFSYIANPEKFVAVILAIRIQKVVRLQTVNILTDTALHRPPIVKMICYRISRVKAKYGEGIQNAVIC